MDLRCQRTRVGTSLSSFLKKMVTSRLPSSPRARTPRKKHVLFRDISSILQPEKEAARIIEGVGFALKVNFKAAQCHPWATVRQFMTFYLKNSSLLFVYYVFRGYFLFLKFLAVPNMRDFFSSLVEVNDLKRVRDLCYRKRPSPTK